MKRITCIFLLLGCLYCALPAESSRASILNDIDALEQNLDRLMQLNLNLRMNNNALQQQLTTLQQTYEQQTDSLQKVQNLLVSQSADLSTSEKRCRLWQVLTMVSSISLGVVLIYEGTH